MDKLTCVYNFNGTIVLYDMTHDIYCLSYLIHHYLNGLKYEHKEIHIITSYDFQSPNIDLFNSKSIFFFKSNLNFTLFFYLHKLRHNYFYKNKITETNDILDIWNNIGVSLDKYPNAAMYHRKHVFPYNLNKELNAFNEIIEKIKTLDINVYDDVIQFKPIVEIPIYNQLLDEINMFLIENIRCISDCEFNFKDYAGVFVFKSYTQIHNEFASKTFTLENVYYFNKYWFDKDKNLLELPEFYSDIEYSQFKNHFENKNFNGEQYIELHKSFQEVTEEVMFLDYIYGFYNFGEFWDVVKRLMVSNIKHLPLFHLTHNRITNIQYYFDRLNYIYPTPYKKEDHNNKLYYFHKVNITTIRGGCRGYIDQYFAYHFNKLFNTRNPEGESYNLYLARSNYGRNIQNEREIVDILKTKYNFIVLDGTETLEETMNYFTNAKIMLGAHGSLMKNLIWCKNNPTLIELCPHTRHDCFYANGVNLGFLTFFIVMDSNDKEEIVMNDTQVENLFRLLDKLLVV